MKRRFERGFVVDATPERVRAFHSDADALRRLTPAPVKVVAGRVEPVEGATLRFRILTPIPIDRTARYEEVRDDGFVDVMLEGPFRSWRHEHRWRPEGRGTRIVDTIVAEPGGPTSRALWATLPATFAYRAWATRRGLKGTRPAQQSPSRPAKTPP